MSARLAKTVILAGTVYRAGQEVPDEVAAQITVPDAIASHTVDDEGGAATSVSVTVDANTAEVQAVLAAAQERIDELTAALAARDEEIVALSAQATPDEANAGSDDPGTAPAVEAVDYSALDVDALKAEIDKRNEGRDGDARISKRGSQETLAALLVADDAAAQQG